MTGQINQPLHTYILYGLIKIEITFQPYRVLFGEYGSGKTQVLIEKVRQVAWEMHFKKITSVIYLFSFADVEVGLVKDYIISI